MSKFNEINDRISNLENVIENLVSSMKKIEDVKKKDELYSFTNQQLIKWLKDNEVDYNAHIKDVLVDVVWKNLNEWEWEYYYEEEEEEEEESEDRKSKKKNNSDNESEESSDSEDQDGKAFKKKFASAM